MSVRSELALISEWIRPGTRVLDLGCGEGLLLRYLRDTRGVIGYGLEIDPDNIRGCVEKGIPVIQTNLDEGLKDFDPDSFDYVVMTQTLQAVRYPEHLLAEILRVGREGIVTFSNMGHWRCRMELALRGRMPVSGDAGLDWYNSPNIHLCTVRDFERLCANAGIDIIERTFIDDGHRRRTAASLLPNLLGEVALYRFKQAAGADP
ncbi:methionine biosynthesis protein MetW [Aquisalimonas sp. 2447]|uniref:methionine biosynthesis protein MetW n=1 Tax=Aquisalimonas sp. 2447 TaxID=2740807 RepID=UPI0014326205|nr:methionine biosynthesis protein MetW [Aquisalimonas sp. 2447]QIT54174.1 methionine biosynthesis protein MetW [Aquisalimonas sp. 2447]